MLGDEVALQEALGKQQQVDPGSRRLLSEALDGAQGRVHVGEDLRGLARADAHPATLYG